MIIFRINRDDIVHEFTMSQIEDADMYAWEFVQRHCATDDYILEAWDGDQWVSVADWESLPENELETLLETCESSCYESAARDLWTYTP